MSAPGPGPSHLVSVGQLKDMLTDRIDTLVAELLPNAKREGHEFFVGGVSGEPGRSMAIHRGGAKAGVWQDFASGEGGDALDLVRAVLFRGNMVEAIKWAKSWLGLDGLDANRLAIKRHAEAKKDRKAEGELEDKRKRELAGRIFAGAEHAIAGTPVDRYLLGRGIDLRQLERPPGILAYVDRCWCEEIKAPLPAMVAAIKRGTTLVGVHRTFLEILPGGQVRKAQLVEAKKTLGPYRGGCVPLTRGADPRGWAELATTEAPATIVLTEGIENGLSIAVQMPSARVIAGISISAMASVELPKCVTEIIIGADNDAPGSRAATKGFPRVVAEHQAQGRKVRVARPPAAHKDFNDWLQALRAGPPATDTGGRDYERAS